VGLLLLLVVVVGGMGGVRGKYVLFPVHVAL
jgi:hypothetical protein